MTDTTTHSQDPHATASDAERALKALRKQLRILRKLGVIDNSKPSGDTFLVNDLLGVMPPLTRSDVEEIAKEALADFDPLAADVDAILRDRGVEVKPGESPYLALLRSISLEKRGNGTAADGNHFVLKRADDWQDPVKQRIEAHRRRESATYHFGNPVPEVRGDVGAGRDRDIAKSGERVGNAHNSSPSVVDAGAHSVGDGPGAGDASATPATEVTLELLVAAVRDANLDIKSLRRIDEAALANYNESGRNLAKAIKDRADSEHALLDYLTGDQA